MPRHQKARARAKTKRRKRRPDASVFEENYVRSSEDVADRTLGRLRNLGNQSFPVSPFSEHIGRWLKDVRDVLSEFELSLTISPDDQFVKERSQILSNVELQLEERRRNEASLEGNVKSLSDDRILLEGIEQEYTSRTREAEGQKDIEIKRLSDNVDALRKELDRVVRTKTGIFRALSKKTKARKEAEAAQRLNSAQSELTSTVQRFTAEQEKLRNEYEKRQQAIAEQIRHLQKEVENQEVDGSIEARRAACEALVNAVNAFLRRERSSPH
jgi:chromosome segregation ATPase